MQKESSAFRLVLRSLLIGGDGGASARDQLTHFKSGPCAEG